MSNHQKALLTTPLERAAARVAPVVTYPFVNNVDNVDIHKMAAAVALAAALDREELAGIIFSHTQNDERNDWEHRKEWACECGHLLPYHEGMDVTEYMYVRADHAAEAIRAWLLGE